MPKVAGVTRADKGMHLGTVVSNGREFPSVLR
jgi:hypothetical protein